MLHPSGKKSAFCVLNQVLDDRRLAVNERKSSEGTLLSFRKASPTAQDERAMPPPTLIESRGVLSGFSSLRKCGCVR